MFRFLITQNCLFRVTLVSTVCIALLPLPGVSQLISGLAQEQSQGETRVARPVPGKPEGTLPNLSDIQAESGLEREAPPPIPSTVRAKKNDGKPWDGRRVGDPWPEKGLDQATDRSRRGEAESSATAWPNQQTQRAHARARLLSPPPVLDDQFVQNFFTYALARNPFSNESSYWYDHLRVAYGQGQESLKLAAVEFGRTLFESAEYAGRNRNNHWYVYDLYKTYLMRDPDSGGWANWEATVATHGREYVRRGFEESGEFSTLLGNLVPNGSTTANASSLISSRVDPRNQPGNGMLTRDVSWNVTLLSLPGRTGLDLGLALAYSSQVWTRSGPYIYFDEDNGFPSPGFRLGFPTVQRKVFDAQTARKAYLLITATGRRVELRQVGTSNIYDAADSSYLRLTDNGSLVLQSTDGTRLSFTYVNGDYRCSEVKDRNGNYITVNHNSLGQITTIVDTLGRVMTFNYDGNANLLSITQSWAGQPSHQWVSFGWGTRTMQSGFSDSSLRGIVGTANGTLLPVITQVALNDTSHYTFDYTNSLQLSVVRNFFGALERNSTSFTYETPAGDAPRLQDSRVSAHNWTGLNNVPAQVITQYSVAGDGACVMTAPDGTIYKEYYGTGWQKGLTTLSEVWSGGVRRKWTTTAWTQDDINLPYPKNPRPYDTSVYDQEGNRRRVETIYTSYNLPEPVALPTEVKEYAANGTTILRRTARTYFNGGQAYLDRRVLGLLREVIVYDASNQPQSKVWYDYDWGNEYWVATPQPATQHDASGVAIGRGNLCWIGRWDVTDIDNFNKHTRRFIRYNRTGSVIKTEDHFGHGNTVNYADSFSDAVNRNTFAYPTTITDADGFSSQVRYNFDFGATTRTQGPPPAGQTQGAIQTMTYNSLGQLERITTTNNSAYKRFWYGADYTASYATVNNVADEAYSIQLIDGAGRVIGAVGNHPGSTGGYRLVKTIYDVMGRASKTSNPAEVNSSWVPSGDDAAGLYYTQQTYDWQGRPLITTNPDGTTKEAGYAGCGCAGGAVVTLTDEGTIDAGVAKRRQQKIYSDVLGRTVKVETLNWQGGSVYSAVVNTYNARDQVTQVRQYAGPEGSGTFQDTIVTYDGYGRLKTRHVPEQNVGTATVWTYNADDTVNTITDARGATKTFGYAGTNRHLIKSMTHTLAGSPTISSTYEYDAVGNRTSMTDALGSVSYGRDQLSRLTSETRTFTGVGSFTINYDYNLANQLTSVTDPFAAQVGYTHDQVGRVTAVTGSNFASVSTYASGVQYRAWGGVKSLTYGNSKTMSLTYDAKLNVATYEVPGVMKKSYQYYNDGRLKFTQDQLTANSKFDRLYRYDHLGRNTIALSGLEAREQGTTNDRPYNETMAYDAFGHLTSRDVRQWDRHDLDVDAYVNNRRTGWTYDADGRLLAGSNEFVYDAAGQISSFGVYQPHRTDQQLDGDGNRAKTVLKTYDTDTGQLIGEEVTYYVYSNVLGSVLSEVSATALKQRGFVFAGGRIMAIQYVVGSTQSVSWEHYDASGASYRPTNAAGSVGFGAERDPFGADAGLFKPFTWPTPTGPGKVEPYYGIPELNSATQGCVADGIPTPCEMALAMAGNGFASIMYIDPALAASGRLREVWVPADTSHGVIDPNTGIMTIYSGPGGYFTWVEDPNAALQTSLNFRNRHDGSRALTSVEVNSLLGDLNKLLADPKCANFLKAMLDQLKTDTGRSNFNTNNMTVLFQKVNTGRGFDVRPGLKGQASAGGGFDSSGNNVASMSINPTEWFADILSPSGSLSRGRIIIHELFHVAGYGHDAIAQAAYNARARYDDKLSWRPWQGDFPGSVPSDPFFAVLDPKERYNRFDSSYSGFIMNVIKQYCE
jgi:YD repeat-containing protein